MPEERKWPPRMIWDFWPHDGGPPVLWRKPCPFPADDADVFPYTLRTREAFAADPLVQEMIAEAVEAEREACAKVADEHMKLRAEETYSKARQQGKLETAARCYEAGDIAAAIRALSGEPLSDNPEAACNTRHTDAEVVECLKKISGALNDAFAAGTEEREGGSGHRQGKLMDRYEAVREEARALLAKLEGGE